MFEIGDLVYYYPDVEPDDNNWQPRVGLIVKAKNLLKLYDVLLQTENIIVKDVDIYSLEKIT